MKATNKTPAALLATPESKKTYEIIIELNQRNVRIIVDDLTLAQQEYNRIRSTSIWNGNWVKGITLDEYHS